MYENYVLKILINTALLSVLDRPEHYELNAEKVSYGFTWKISESSAMFLEITFGAICLHSFSCTYIFMIKEK